MALLLRRRINRCLLGSLAAAIFLLAASVVRAQTTPPLPSPNPFRFVNDYAGVMDPVIRDRLEARLKQLQVQTKIEFAVVVVKTTGDQEIFDYSLALARGWGIGSKEDDNPGLMLVYAIDDRKGFTQVSRDLEGDLPDGFVGQAQRENIIPFFRAGKYAEGINNTVEAYITRLEEQRGFKLQTNTASKHYEVETRRSGIGLGTICLGVIILIIVLIILARFGNRRGGGFGGGGGGGLWNALLIGSLISNVSRGGSGGWSSGGFGDSGGSWGGGRGGDSGGFGGGGFGGGGDFGGGGAGVSW